MILIRKIFEKHRIYIPLIMLAISAASLGSAYIAEYGFDLKPCILCLYQRVPFAVIMALSLIYLAVAKRFNLTKYFLIICAITFLVGSSIGAFQVGVEQKWWEGTQNCGGSISGNIEELRKMIFEAPVVRCDEPQFVFLGISMAGYNFIYSLFLGIISICSFMRLKNHEKHK